MGAALDSAPDTAASVGGSEDWLFDDFAPDAEVRLRRGLVARYGVELGVEACAEAMAYAWTHWDRVRTMANPVGYLYRVGQSAVRSQTRHRTRRVDLPTESLESAGVLRSVDDTATPPDPCLADALGRLTRDQRVAVVLVYAHGYRYEEAAATLDIPVSTLRNHLHRGLAKLRSHLGYES